MLKTNNFYHLKRGAVAALRYVFSVDAENTRSGDVSAKRLYDKKLRDVPRRDGYVMGRHTLNRYHGLVGGLLVALLALVAGCDAGPGESLYKEGESYTADGDPQIESLDPAGKALAGVGPVTINGQNFVPDTSVTRVYFNGVRAEMLEVTDTSLSVRPPDVTGDSVSVRVSVVGAEQLGTATYRLDPAVRAFGDFGANEKPWAIATDDAANVYVSLFADGSPAGIKRITPPESERTGFAPAQSWRYSGIKIGPNGTLYGARGPGPAPVIYRAPDGGGNLGVWLLKGRIGPVRALDVNDQGDVWTGGDSEKIYRAEAEDSTVTAFNFVSGVRTVQAMRLHDGALYVAAVRGSASSIWRAPIEGDGLGAFEEYFAFSDEYNQGVGAYPGLKEYAVDGATALALAFAQDGTMYVGTDAPAGVVAVAPGGGSAETLYSGLFEPSIVSLAWGEGRFLYATRVPSGDADDPGGDLPQTILRIDTQKQGAR
jgi:hypothetical protein